MATCRAGPTRWLACLGLGTTRARSLHQESGRNVRGLCQAIGGQMAYPSPRSLLLAGQARCRRPVILRRSIIADGEALLDRRDHLCVGQDARLQPAPHLDPELTISHSRSPPWVVRRRRTRVQAQRRLRSLPPRAPAPVDLSGPGSRVRSPFLNSRPRRRLLAHQWMISPRRGEIDRVDGAASMRTRPSADLTARRWA